MENKAVTFLIVGVIVGALIGVGAGYALFHTNNSSDAQEYSFYLNFGENDERTGWYSGNGGNATGGFDAAMEKANFKYEVSSWGYISTIDGEGSTGWYVAQYLYNETTKNSADASILYPVESYGTLSVSNGWKAISGYDWEGGLKIGEFNSEVFYLSMYQSDYSAASPVSDDSWMTSGPFA